MKKVFLFCGALLVMTAAMANAAGHPAHLTVADCFGVHTANWTCTSNTGLAFTTVASVVVPPLTTLTGEETTVEIAFATPVPEWWRLGGTCRAANAIAVGFNGGAYSCRDYFGEVTGVLGANSYQIGPDAGVGDPNGPIDAARVRMRFISACNYDIAIVTPPPAEFEEIFLFSMAMNKSKSNGLGSCVGCLAPACMVIRNVKLTQPAGVGDPVVGLPDVAETDNVTMQGGVGTDCPNSTPTTRSSWGQIKSLYR